MNKNSFKQLIHQTVKEVFRENLILKKHENDIIVVSDEQDRKKASQETYRNKEALKRAGFRWDGILNSWKISGDRLQVAKSAISQINKKPLEIIIDKLSDLPEFIQHADNLSKKDELSQKIDSFITGLSTEVDEKKASEEIRRFLEFNSKFYNYSIYNTFLIYLQKPNATKVAGFKQWEEKFHRRVKKGAKSITILAPIKITPKTDLVNNPTSPIPSSTSPLPSPPDDDDTDTDVKKSYVRFIGVNVFDISDTEPIDERGSVPTVDLYGANTPDEKADHLYNLCLELANDMGIKVDRASSNRGEGGWSSGNHINITSTLDGVNKAAVLIHEMAHELMHFNKSSIFYIGDETEKSNNSREMYELQAESVTYVVLKHYDFPATHQTTYLALWKANKDSIMKNFSLIKKVSKFIINELNKLDDSSSTTSTT